MARYHQVDRDDGTVVEIAITERVDGDFHIDAPGVASRRAAVLEGGWRVVRQVHGRRVIDADAVPGELEEPEEADALLTAQPGVAIGVQGADCAPVAVLGTSGPIGVAHVGWRGLAAGVLDELVDRIEQAGVRAGTAVVGPHIGAPCYEFGATDLDALAESLGDEVRGETSEGKPALDLGRGIASVLTRRGVIDVRFHAPCTGCQGGGWSHRARRERERHALAARIVVGSGT